MPSFYMYMQQYSLLKVLLWKDTAEDFVEDTVDTVWMSVSPLQAVHGVHDCVEAPVSPSNLLLILPRPLLPSSLRPSLVTTSQHTPVDGQTSDTEDTQHITEDTETIETTETGEKKGAFMIMSEW